MRIEEALQSIGISALGTVGVRDVLPVIDTTLASGTALATITRKTSGSSLSVAPPMYAISDDETQIIVSGTLIADVPPIITEAMTGAINTPRRVDLSANILPVGSYADFPDTLSTFAAIGDSFTVGVTGLTDPNNAWVKRVATHFGATALNKGISGSVLQSSFLSNGLVQSQNMHDRYKTDVLGGNKRDFTFVAGGFNDARYTASSMMNPDSYANDLREMLWGMILGGYAQDDICVVSPWWISDAGFSEGGSGFTGQTRDGFEEYVFASRYVAREFGVYWADAYSAIRDNGGASLVSSDKIHCNDAGHAVIADAILAAKRYPRTAPVDLYASYTVYDDFLSPNNTSLIAHKGERGAKWTAQVGIAVAAATIYNGRVFFTGNSIFQAFSAPQSSDYKVTGEFYCVSELTADSVGVAVRMSESENTLYWAQYSRASGGFRLFKTVAGTNTQIGSTYTAVISAGQSFTIELEAVGSSLRVLINGIERITATDAAISGAGKGGIRSSIAQSASAGCHLERFELTDA